MKPSSVRRSKIAGTHQGVAEALVPQIKRDVALGWEAREKPFPADTTPILHHLMQAFSANEAPIEVSFRGLVPWIKVGERATHYLHPYPAKLLPHIAHFFLGASSLADLDDAVLDPFAGTGTVALETVLSRRKALYADVNPLARLIAAVKTRTLDPPLLRLAYSQVEAGFKRSRVERWPDVVNIEHWYDLATIRSLCRLKAAIAAIDDAHISDFLRVTFSAVARKSSLADPRFSVPVRRSLPRTSEKQSLNVWRLFNQQFDMNSNRLETLIKLSGGILDADCVGEDARTLGRKSEGSGRFIPLPSDSVGLVITSPPYAGAQKYVRAASLSLGWLDLVPAGDLRPLEELTIGREHHLKARTTRPIITGIEAADRLISKVFRVNRLRATIAACYLLEMRSALTEAVRVLKPGGSFVLVIGDNKVCGENFASSLYLCQMLEEAGLTVRLKLVDTIRSRCLITTRARTADIITREWILLFEKPTTKS